jgi:hypothetical protein
MFDVDKIKKPSRIFVGSTMELFGKWIEPRWLEAIFGFLKAQIKKIYDWGMETCPHYKVNKGIYNPMKRECEKCWTELLRVL